MRLRIALLAVTVALAAAGCSSSGDSADTGGDGGTITWWDTSDATTEAPVYRELVTQFQAQHPSVKVNYVNVPFSDAEQKFKTAAQGGNGAPDVMRSDVGWTPAFAAQGYLLPLDGTPALDQLADFLAGPVGTAKFDGKMYGAPQVTDTLGLLYNRALFAKAGLTAATTTWAQLKTAARTLRAKAGVDGVYLNPDSYFLLPFLYGEGANLVDVPAKKITVNAPEAVRGVQIAQDLLASGAAAEPAYTDGYAAMQAAFKDGKVAMIINGPWSAADIFSGKSFKDKTNLGIAPVPAGSTGKAGAPVGGHNLVVYAGTKHASAAEQFVQFMTSATSESSTAAKLGTLPARTSAYTAEVTKDPVVASFRQVMATAQPRPALAQASDLLGPLSQDYVKILQGEPARSGLDNSAKEFAKLLPGWSAP